MSQKKKKINLMYKTIVNFVRHLVKQSRIILGTRRR